MAERELNIWVRLKNLGPSAASLKSLGGGFMSLGRQAVGGISSIASSIFNLKNLIMGGLVYGAYRALKGVVMDIVGAYAESEAASSRLLATLQSTGQGGAAAADELARYAAQLQKTTVYEDDFLKGVMASGLNLGIQGSQIKEATATAIGLAKVMGGDVDSAMRSVAMAYGGNWMMLQRYIPELRKAGTEEEKLAILRRKGAEGMRQAEMETRTASGSMKQLGNTWGDLKESVGQFIATSPAVQKFFGKLKEGIEDGIKWIEAHRESIEKFVNQALTWLGDKAESVWKTFQGWAKDGTLYGWLLKIKLGLQTIWYGAEVAFRSMQRLVTWPVAAHLTDRMLAYEKALAGISRMEALAISPKATEGEKRQAVEKANLLRGLAAKNKLSPDEDRQLNQYLETDDQFFNRMKDGWNGLMKTAGEVNDPLAAQTVWLNNIEAAQQKINAGKRDQAKLEGGLVDAVKKQVELSQEQRSELETFAMMGRLKQEAVLDLMKRASGMTAAGMGNLSPEEKEIISGYGPLKQAYQGVAEQYATEEMRKRGITKIGDVDLSKLTTPEKIDAQAKVEIAINVGEDIVSKTGQVVGEKMRELLVQVQAEIERQIGAKRNAGRAGAIATQMAGG